MSRGAELYRRARRALGGGRSGNGALSAGHQARLRHTLVRSSDSGHHEGRVPRKPGGPAARTRGRGESGCGLGGRLGRGGLGVLAGALQLPFGVFLGAAFALAACGARILRASHGARVFSRGFWACPQKIEHLPLFPPGPVPAPTLAAPKTPGETERPLRTGAHGLPRGDPKTSKGQRQAEGRERFNSSGRRAFPAIWPAEAWRLRLASLPFRATFRRSS